MIDPHFVTFSSGLYTTICNLKLNPNPNPDRNPTVINDLQIGPTDSHMVTVQIPPFHILSHAKKTLWYLQARCFSPSQHMVSITDTTGKYRHALRITSLWVSFHHIAQTKQITSIFINGMVHTTVTLVASVRSQNR